ncbi:hypothetical protein J7T55_006745 [Diaporthe amygdali]|uniref:uncharacterized protein n=1 Tax=Phomopsis amygdali TaxID=1214568 RepID=UPI0022FE5644|nr:uncharacterized protein J7T55_006745 [Diaporthe amygdali]KAJ0125399.1 hypothetical protein J7T55_006745 [Diaporthe amygdali]
MGHLLGTRRIDGVELHPGTFQAYLFALELAPSIGASAWPIPRTMIIVGGLLADGAGEPIMADSELQGELSSCGVAPHLPIVNKLRPTSDLTTPEILPNPP